MLLTQTVIFMPDGRRVLTCSQNGEFTLWNAASFNFETILQAHNNPVRTATVSHSENWLISADDSGQIKYWQMNWTSPLVIHLILVGMSLRKTKESESNLH